MSNPSKSLRRGAVVTCLCLVALMAVTGEAWAACKKTDIKGTYDFYEFFGAKFGDGTEVGTLFCLLKVSKNGAIKGGTKCDENSSRFGKESFKLGGGKLAVASNCQVTGTIRDDEGCKYTLRRAWMAKDKNTMSGVGEDCDGLFWMFTAVKR